MTFSEYVRKVRRGLDMSQHELAKELNINYTIILKKSGAIATAVGELEKLIGEVDE